jgi:hypothetical protein
LCSAGACVAIIVATYLAGRPFPKLKQNISTVRLKQLRVAWKVRAHS